MSPITDSVAALCRDWPGPARGKLLAALLDVAVAELDFPPDQDAADLTPAAVPADSMIAQALALADARTVDLLCELAPLAFNGELPGCAEAPA